MLEPERVALAVHSYLQSRFVRETGFDLCYLVPTLEAFRRLDRTGSERFRQLDGLLTILQDLLAAGHAARASAEQPDAYCSACYDLHQPLCRSRDDT